MKNLLILFLFVLGLVATETVEAQSVSLKGVRVRVNPAKKYRNSEQEYTAECPVGTSGTPVTVTVARNTYISYVSQAQADSLAYAAAQSLALSQLSCSPTPTIYSSIEKSYTASCPSGYSGTDKTVTKLAGAYTSTISQENADSLALSAAKAEAISQLQCTIIVVIYYNASQSFTAECSGGKTGTAVTVTKGDSTFTSLVSIADANSRALAAATLEANNAIVCVFSSTEQSFTAVCPTGFTGSDVTVTKTAGSYTSTISQADANAKALNAATAEATAALSCTPSTGVNLSALPRPATPDTLAMTPPGETYFNNAAATAPSSPVIAEWTRQTSSAVTSNQNIIIAGEGFATSGVSALGYANNAQPFDMTTGVETVNGSPAMDSDKGVVRFPTGLTWGMYCVWPKNSSGAYGRPVFVNRTEAWWVGSDKSWVGGSVSIHGRNLSYQNGTSTSHVYLKSSSGTITACTETSVNPYRVTFTVPSVANGTYEVWVHNGHGGRYGWSKSPNSLIVGAVQAWSGTINVTSAPYNAQGNGSTDDRAAIQAAINAAAANSTVYFPTGTYIINGPLTLKSNIRLAGDSKTLSTIKLGSGYVTSGQGAIVLNAGTANVKFQSIGIDFNAENVGAEGGVYARNCSDITFASFKLSSENMAGGGNVGLSGGGDRMDFQNTNYVYWDSVDYIGSMMFFGASKHVYCTNSNIYMTNDANSVFVMWGVKWFSITNTTLQNLANTTTGQGKGRFVSGTGIWGATGNHYFGNNQIIRVCPRQATGVDQNSGEVFMYEGNKSFWVGQPTNTTATTFGTGTFSGGGGLLAFINAGKGLGQWRRVTSNFNGVATIDRAWDVIPDGTSKITIGVYQSNIAVYNNDFSGQQIAVTSSTHIANTAVEPFGGCVNYIVDGNTIDTMRYAIGNYATRHASGVGGLSNDPTYWCIYQNNTINYTRWPVTNNYQPGEPGTAAAPQTTNGMALFGIVYRNNTVTNSLIATEENGAINTLAPTITNCFIYERGFTPISTAIPNKVAYTNP